MSTSDIPEDLAREMETVQAVYDAFASDHPEDGIAYLTDDVVLDFEATSSVAGRRVPYEGHRGVRDYLEDTARVWEGLVVTPRTFHPAHGHVVVHGEIRGRIAGRDITTDLTWTWIFRDGKISSVRASGLKEVLCGTAAAT